MLKVLICLCVVVALLGAMLLADKFGWLKSEGRRKFFHVTAGSFLAFWPWFMSLNTIKFLGLAMLAGVLMNHYLRVLDFNKGLTRRTYGVAFVALGIVLTASLAHSKVVFCLAILTVALADGLAALFGTHYGRQNRYKIFGQTKSVVGSIVFWLVSLVIFGVGLRFTDNAKDYLLLIFILPPLLTATENVSPFGLDNLALPIVCILALRFLAGAN